MTPRRGTGRLRVTRELMNQLLSANNYEVESALPRDDEDERAGLLSFLVSSPVLPVLESGAPLPEVVCTVTEHRRQSDITPQISKEQKP